MHKILQNSCIVLYFWGHAHVYTKLVSHGQILVPHHKAGHPNTTQLLSAACIQVPFAQKLERREKSWLLRTLHPDTGCDQGMCLAEELNRASGSLILVVT